MHRYGLSSPLEIFVSVGPRHPWLLNIVIDFLIFQLENLSMTSPPGSLNFERGGEELRGNYTRNTSPRRDFGISSWKIRFGLQIPL